MKHWQDFLHRNTVLFILCILSNQGWGQSTNENFEILYKHLIEIPDSNFVSRGDSLIEKLYLTNLQNHEHDSLISAILLENFHRKRTKSTFGEFLDLTRKTENLLLKLKVIPNQYLADLHYQFVVAFNHFQIRDSAEHHRTLMNGYINRIKAPNQLVISLAYENAKQAYFAGDYTAQLAFLNNGLDYLNKHFPDEIMTKLNFLNGIGIGYRRSHQYQKAVRHHEETLNFIEKNQEKVPKGWVGNVLNNLGLCHNDLGHFPQAIHFMKEALSAYQILGPNYQDQIGTEYANIAKAYADWGHPDSAIYYNLTSL
ncbi:MAG: tetratricopeptide repeat protein, partial [Saprospiraceae bacterium]|nr:tetratricopeptide repeat protein [Saprospiraceae bacterium]